MDQGDGPALIRNSFDATSEVRKTPPADRREFRDQIHFALQWKSRSMPLAAALNAGDTAWMLTSTALVLFMMIPGLAMFYAGLVRRANVLSVYMQCFALTCLLSVIWLVCGYSLVFTTSNPVCGSLAKSCLTGVTANSMWGETGIPELLGFAYQMTFFIITPGLMIGAWVERMKFSAVMIFSALWSLLVYVPIAHMVWGPEANMFGLTGVIDHAGGIVVHITAGIGALVACVLLGKRLGFPSTPMPPHNLPMAVVGAGMLWVGWFGFNAGSGMAANGAAAMTMVVTHISASVAALVWLGLESRTFGKPSVLGVVTGSIAGLAAITPASGTVGPLGAVVIGATSACICWMACAKLKKKFGYDDSLDVFGVHGVGGIVGTILVGAFASPMLGGNQPPEFSIASQLGTQLGAALITAVWSGIVSVILLRLTDALVGLRVTQNVELAGLDLAEHGEAAYND